MYARHASLGRPRTARSYARSRFPRPRQRPIDDEPVTEEEKLAVAESREWLRHNPGIPFEQVVAELGFTMEEIRNYQDPS